MNKNLLFFIDVAPGSGRGHLVRSLEIINQLKRQYWNLNIVTEKCEPDVYLDQLKRSSNTFHEITPGNTILLGSILEIAEKTKSSYVIIDSYKVKFTNVNWLDQFKIYRIIDSPQVTVKGIIDIKIGIRFDLQNTGKEMKVLYPIRKIPRNKILVKHRQKILFYFGSEPSQNAINDVVNIIEKLPLAIKIYVYAPNIASKNGRIIYLNDIDPVFNQMSLIIGSASNIMYEATVNNIPMITISTNDSQVNSDDELLKIGAIFNLSIADLYQSSEVATLICNVLSNINIIKKFTKDCRGNIYPNSSEFIAMQIGGKEKNTKIEQDLSIYSKNQLDIRKLELSNINELLKWRNSNEVRSLMSTTKEISRISHYNWWFENTRSNYVLYVDNKPQLYLWHQLLLEKDLEIFVGGWMPMSSTLSPFLIIDALNWQLQLTQSISKDAIWLAIINKHNTFTNFINDRLGFKKIDDQSEMKTLATQIFNVSSNSDNFFFYQYNFTS